jgi:hypothetical protein
MRNDTDTGSPPAPLSRGLELWWARVPRWAGRFSWSSFRALTDGYYIASVPIIGAIASPLALLIGLWIGAFHPGFEEVVGESLALLILVVALGSAGAHLGTLWLIGFVLGDFLVAHPPWSHSITVTGPAAYQAQLSYLDYAFQVRFPLLVEYLGLWLVLGRLAVTTKIVTYSLTRRLRRSGRMGRFLRQTAIQGALAFGIVLTWAYVAILFFRPAYAFPGLMVPSAIGDIRSDAVLLGAVAALTTASRMLVQLGTASLGTLSDRTSSVERAISLAVPSEPPFAARMRPVVRWSVGAFVATVLLAGVLVSVTAGVMLFAVFFLVGWLRESADAGWLAWWARTTNRLTPIRRYALAAAVVALVVRIVPADKLSVVVGPSWAQFGLVAFGVVVFAFAGGPSPRSRAVPPEPAEVGAAV